MRHLDAHRIVVYSLCTATKNVVDKRGQAQMNSKLIEVEDFYSEESSGCTHSVLILDHIEFGKLLLIAYKEYVTSLYPAYRCGMAIKLKDSDTLDSLNELLDIPPYLTPLEQCVSGYDSARPVLNMSGNQVHRIAVSVGVPA